MTKPAAPSFGPAFGPDYGFGAYLHWPFCTRICPYCDFNVYAAKSRDPDQLLAAMHADISAHRLSLPDHPPLNSIFFGGGTPSLMTGAQIEHLISTLADCFGLARDCEITLEANPNDITQETVRDWHKAGINRLSIGLQSLNDDALAFLGRDHSSEDARRATDIALDEFASISVDAIYARPAQSVSAWERELRAILALGAQHLSLYELTIEPATAFGKRAARGELTPMPDDHQAALYELTEDITKSAGLPAYEVSNHARSQQHRSVHNQIYWRSGDWLGIGPGAHGRVSLGGKRVATKALDHPSEYIARQTEERTALSDEDTAYELLAMGLRPIEGIARTRIEQQFGRKLNKDMFSYLLEGGWLNLTESRVSLTAAGRLLADRVTLEIVQALSSDTP